MYCLCGVLLWFEGSSLGSRKIQQSFLKWQSVESQGAYDEMVARWAERIHHGAKPEDKPTTKLRDGGSVECSTVKISYDKYMYYICTERARVKKVVTKSRSVLPSGVPELNQDCVSYASCLEAG